MWRTVAFWEHQQYVPWKTARKKGSFARQLREKVIKVHQIHAVGMVETGMNVTYVLHQSS